MLSVTILALWICPQENFDKCYFLAHWPFWICFAILNSIAGVGWIIHLYQVNLMKISKDRKGDLNV